jgi:hypothetical protein
MLLSITRVAMDSGQLKPRSADPETALAVDKMILEYLLYKATKGLLAERQAAKQGDTLELSARPDAPLQMIHGTLSNRQTRTTAHTFLSIPPDVQDKSSTRCRRRQAEMPSTIA